MQRPTIAVTITDENNEELHRETRRAFNAGIRASEDAMRKLALERHTVLTGGQPLREGPRHAVGDTYLRPWFATDGEGFLATVTVTEVP